MGREKRKITYMLHVEEMLNDEKLKQYAINTAIGIGTIFLVFIIRKLPKVLAYIGAVAGAIGICLNDNIHSTIIEEGVKVRKAFYRTDEEKAIDAIKELGKQAAKTVEDLFSSNVTEEKVATKYTCKV